ncbi:MBL fold metallo-hydrolase [Aeromonas schubertii]|uniref:MBL fold metallo-hydrolase n=1 Tax=Aeromonas schubertii TaxID=652 RepID=A0ABS7VC22_9GAMM|nr:MBL fold metallo-hydrolase [Aeromonas schubertii]MBZ6066940.1 MBL fold metallo-hydrolase [Aeromonas schubertii]
MKITQVRNATLLIDYAGQRFLIDPMLSERGSFPGFAGTANSHLRNPLVDLPLPLDTLTRVDAILVTHRHPDHWDETASRRLPKDLPLFSQHADDAARFVAEGFRDVRRLDRVAGFGDIHLHRTGGQHGGEVVMAALGARLGEVCGVVFSHPDEPTLYLAGDTVWHPAVAEALATHTPDVVVLNCGDAQFPELGRIIMGSDDVLAVCHAAPQATLIASHMEAVNHATLSRAALRDTLTAHGIQDRVRIPQDGESLTFPATAPVAHTPSPRL